MNMTGTEKPFSKALITGAAGDLGSELARCLAAAGVNLVLTDIAAAPLAAVADELRRYPGMTVSTFAADLTDHAALEQRLREIADAHPDIDLLMANAGVDIGAPIERYDWRKAKLQFDVNTLANYVLFCVFLPRFLERGHGHVTATISLGGLVGTPYEHAYNGSKAAMRMLMDGLRAETRGRGVGFTSVFPSYLQGRMIQGNQFDVKQATPMRTAAEKIVAATLARRQVLKFPWQAALKISLAGLLPVHLRDRLVMAEMIPPGRASE
jgi:short-subunit dehydrogenase